MCNVERDGGPLAFYPCRRVADVADGGRLSAETVGTSRTLREGLLCFVFCGCAQHSTADSDKGAQESSDEAPIGANVELVCSSAASLSPDTPIAYLRSFEDGGVTLVLADGSLVVWPGPQLDGDPFRVLLAAQGPYVVATYHDGCAFCQRELDKKTTFFPTHDASPRCRSGRKPHCTCDACF